MHCETEFSISYIRPESHQLFFLFVGAGESLTIKTLDFIRTTAVGDRNIVIIKDPYYGHCYQSGISAEYNSLDGIVQWQQEELQSRFPHVREVFCAGTSAGGGAAIHTAYRLRARAGWSLAGRIVNTGLIEERDRVSKDFYQKIIGRPNFRQADPDEHAKLVAAFEDPEMRELRWNLTGNPETVVAWPSVEALVNLLHEDSVSTDFHFYYATTNVIDRKFAEAFQTCPRVALHPITPPESWHWKENISFTEPDHGIVTMLYEMSQLGTVFSAYL
jgi:hypothetical protein